VEDIEAIRIASEMVELASAQYEHRHRDGDDRDFMDILLDGAKKVNERSVKLCLFTRDSPSCPR
jgi:hypothetical protein